MGQIQVRVCVHCAKQIHGCVQESGETLDCLRQTIQNGIVLEIPCELQGSASCPILRWAPMTADADTSLVRYEHCQKHGGQDAGTSFGRKIATLASARGPLFRGPTS